MLYTSEESLSDSLGDLLANILAGVAEERREGYVLDAIQGVSAYMDAQFSRGGYATPLDGAVAALSELDRKGLLSLLKLHCQSLCVRHLVQGVAVFSEAQIQGIEAAEKWLLRIAEGKEKLPGLDVDQQQVEKLVAGQVGFVSSGRTFAAYDYGIRRNLH